MAIMEEKYDRTDKEIKNEIYKVLENLNQSHELLCIVGSWMDTIEKEDILAMLIDYNRGVKSITELN